MGSGSFREAASTLFQFLEGLTAPSPSLPAGYIAVSRSVLLPFSTVVLPFPLTEIALYCCMLCGRGHGRGNARAAAAAAVPAGAAALLR